MHRFALVAGLVAGLVLSPFVPAWQAGAAASVPPGFHVVGYRTGQAPGNLANFFWLDTGGLVTSGRDGTITYVSPSGKPHYVEQVAKVRVVGNHGMLGFAPAGDYRTTGRVYITYDKRDPDSTTGHGMVEEWIASPPEAPTSFRWSRTILDGNTLYPELVQDSSLHAIDSVLLAPDGTLWVSVGDDSGNNGDPDTLRAQDLDQPFGKLLHITRDGDGVRTNPFYQAGAPRSWRSMVYAYGFRNPFRFALDPRTGRPVVGDVGWKTVEEVDTLRPGDNAGWPCYEGRLRPAFVANEPVCQQLYAAGTARMPIVTYRHRGYPSAVVGGMFYRGTSYPQAYRGAFFYGDYGRGRVWSLRTDRAGALTRRPETPALVSGVGLPVAFHRGPNGDVTFADIGGGKVYRLMTAIDAKFAALPHPWRLLGDPVGAEYRIAGGRVRRYTRGAIYWSRMTGAHEVHGAIRAAYRAHRGPRGCLGFPVTDVHRIPDGRRSRFSSGRISYWPARNRVAVACRS